jgi:membrane protease YdiL (CAAX protease family)
MKEMEGTSVRDRLGNLLKTRKLASLGAMIFILLVGAILLWQGNTAKKPLLTLLSIILVWMSIRGLLWLRRSSWREFGLTAPKNWPITVLAALGWTIALHILIHFFLSPIVIKWTGKPVELSQFDQIRGNVTALLIGLAIVWTLAAFGEEMIFRGYIMSRLAGIFKNKNLSWAAATLVSSLLFGISHFYQGISGMILIGIVGLIYAAAYLAAGKNLWVTILIHGFYDTSAFLVIFFNLDKTTL